MTEELALVASATEAVAMDNRDLTMSKGYVEPVDIIWKRELSLISGVMGLAEMTELATYIRKLCQPRHRLPVVSGYQVQLIHEK